MLPNIPSTIMEPSSPSSSPWDSWLDASVADLKRQSLFRTLRPTIPTTSAVQVQMTAAEFDAWLNDAPSPRPSYSAFSTFLPTATHEPPLAELKTVKLFSLNDYLGLSTHPRVRAAAAEAAQAYGNGPRSSALVGGYTCYHRDLETALAQLKSTEEALLFPTGFAANLAVISALAAAGDVDIFSDELNHASIIDGARLGRRSGGSSRLFVYRHKDLHHLEQLLLKSFEMSSSTTTPETTSHGATPSSFSSSSSSFSNPQVKTKRRQLVVTDSLFSMDGDFADLQGLAALRQKYGFLLAVDEAHATLVCGSRGQGAAAVAGVEHCVDLHIGTLSKAFGCLGGFVACSSQWKGLFVNVGRAQVFSTSLPVPVVASAQAALQVSYDEPWRRHHLEKLVERVGNGLGVVAHSPIIPVVLGGETVTMQACSALLRRGFHVPGIRPPTVPAGTSRLRLSLSAAHSVEDVDEMVAAVKAVLESDGLKSGSSVVTSSRL